MRMMKSLCEYKILIGTQTISSTVASISDTMVNNLNSFKGMNWFEIFKMSFEDPLFERIFESISIVNQFEILGYYFSVDREHKDCDYIDLNIERYYIEFDKKDDAMLFKLVFSGPNIESLS